MPGVMAPSLIKLHAINALGSDCSVNLFCFPYGGGNARAYDEAWAQSLPPHIQAYAFELPGRGSLSNAPTINDINVLVKAAAAAMREHLDRPFAIFGHSVGAVMAWALARHLETRGDHHTPIVTICSGHTAPSQPTTQMHKWSTDELANEMRGWGNVDEEVLSDPDVVEFLCKTLRSDFEITETFCGTTEALNMERLRCRLVVCGGDADPLVSSEELRIWHEECAETTTTTTTTTSSSTRVYAGDHFYLTHEDNAADFVRHLAADIDMALEEQIAHADALYRGEQWTAGSEPWPTESLVHTLCLFHDGEPFANELAVSGYRRISSADGDGDGDAAEERIALTFTELRARAAIVATTLRARYGASQEKVVALLMERGVDFTVALFGILSSGAAYLELFGSSPKGVLAEQLEAASALATLTNRANVHKVPDTIASCPVVLLEDALANDAIVSASAAADTLRNEVWNHMSGDSLCFIVLSSGTTGKPKLMMDPHRLSTHSYYFRNKRFPLGPGDTCGIYVFAIWEIFRPLLAGAHALCIPDSVLFDMESLCHFVGEAGITQILFTPSLCAQIFSDNASVHLASVWSSLKTLLLCGEVITQDLLATCRERLPHTEVLSEYSISECGTVTLGDVRNTHPMAPYSHAGTGDPNVRIYILDDDLRPCPIGCVGELYVGGPCLSNGYSNEEITRERFVPDPFVSGAEAGGDAMPLMFRTGDAGRFVDADGELAVELHGRVAFMIKLRGYSIVPGNVEAAILSHDAIDNCCVKGNTDKGNTDFLIAYSVVVKNATQPTDAEMKEFLKPLLPHYCVPSVFVYLEEMPINENTGKLDRKRLPAVKAPTHDAAPDSAAGPSNAPQRKFIVTATEKRVADAWCAVLPALASAAASSCTSSRESVVDPSSSFFDAGGNSLLVTRAIKAMASETGVKLAVHEFFENATVSKIAEVIDRRTKSASSPLITSNDDGGAALVSSAEMPLPLPFAGYDSAATQSRDVALLTCAFELPGASTETEYWSNLVHAKECITFLTRDQLLETGLPASLVDSPEYVPACGMLQRSVYGFDNAYFSISRREACIMDPQQRLFLESCRESLELSGYANQRYVPRFDGKLPTEMDDPSLLDTIGCYGGVFMPLYGRRMTADPEDPSHELLVETGCDKDYTSMRVGFMLNLKGPCMTIQTSCSTSLANVASACSGTLSGDCTMALAGASSLIFPQHAGYMYMDGMPVSPDGRCRPFDIDAAGTVFSDGVGTVFLKHMGAAKRDRDTVKAVVRGWAVNNDGSSKSNFTAPSSQGQRLVVLKALRTARLNPQAISYVEAHGTATKLGDPIEVAALIEAFGATTASHGGSSPSASKAWCAIGSAKGGIGHANIASGMAGLIKLMLVIRNRQNVPVVHFRSPNPLIPFDGSPFKMPIGPEEAAKSGPSCFAFETNGKDLIAGISNLGVGGTNVHVIVGEAPDDNAGDANHKLTQLQPKACVVRNFGQPIIVSASSSASCNALCRRLADVLENDSRFDSAEAFDDVAYTLRVGRRELSHRVSVIATSAADAAKKLRASSAGDEAKKPAGIVFLFPGQGSQYVNMGRDLYEQIPDGQFRHWMDRCFELFREELGVDLKSIVYPSSDADTSSASDMLNDTINSQPALFSVEYAMAKHLESLGIRPHALAGHSIGEVVAAALAGVFPSLEVAVKVVSARARAMQMAPAGAMLSVGMSAVELTAIIKGAGLEKSCHVACANSPTSSIACGTDSAVEKLEYVLPESAARRRLHVKKAFHSPALSGAAEDLVKTVESISASLAEPKYQLMSNVTGTMLMQDDAVRARYWGDHITSTVRFEENVDFLLQEGYDAFVEVGPMNTLTRLLRENISGSARSIVPRTVNTMRHPKDTSVSDVDALTAAVCAHWRDGGVVDLASPSWNMLVSSAQVLAPRRIELCAPVPDRKEFEQKETAAPAATAVPCCDGKLKDVSSWICVPSFAQRPPSMGKAVNDASNSRGRVLLFADCDAAPLSGALETDGWDVATCAVVDENKPEHTGALTVRSGEDELEGDLGAVLEAQSRDSGGLPSKVVVLSSGLSDEELREDGSVHAYSYSGWVLLRNLSVALSRYPDVEVTVHVVAAGLVAVSEGEKIRPSASLLTGPAIVAPQEYPNISVQLVDVPLGAAMLASRTVAAIAAELRLPTLEPADKIIAIRRNRTWRLSYEPAFAAAPSHSSVADAALARGMDELGAGGSYLLTGGLGRIGLKLARSIAAAVAARGTSATLYMQTRSGFPERDAWQAAASCPSAERHAVCIALLDIEAAGEGAVTVHVIRANIADRVEVDAMLRTISETTATTQLTGLLHLAGDMDLRYLADCTSKSLRRLAEPKVASLHNLVDGARVVFSSISFAATFSSMAGVLGGYQMGAYTSANSYMDAYSHAVSFDDDNCIARRWVSVCWDDWKQEYAANEQNAAYALNNHDRFAIDADEGFRALAYAIGMESEPQILVSTRPVQGRMERWWYHRSSSLGSSSSDDGEDSSMSGHSDGASESYGGVLGICCAAYATVLGLGRASTVSPSDSFYALGGDSLLTAKVLSTLRKSLPSEYASSLRLENVISNPTPSSLAECIEGLEKTTSSAAEKNGRSLPRNESAMSAGGMYDSAGSRPRKRRGAAAPASTRSSTSGSNRGQESDDSLLGESAEFQLDDHIVL